MPLVIGSRLGSYEIVSPIGAGGMGEVYRARDTKLNRDVALKVLLAVVSNDPDRLARFRREAQVLASLNHSNIAHIHGFEESGDIGALVMEFVDGPTLADRIVRGPIPLDEAIPIAKQIADALEAAHEQGIVHRDLKPANIKVRDDGTVKVLDFGLAKVVDPVASVSGSVSMSPTLTTPAMTQMGMIMGTAAYMAPEQAKGRPVDKRADIWAFGCVLYEMLTGRRVFDGEDVSDTLAFVITCEPDWSALPPNTPATIRRLLERCLQKDRKKRLHDIGDARLELDEPVAPPSPAAVAFAPPAPVRGRPIAWIAALVGASAVTAAAVWMLTRPAPAATLNVQRLTITQPEAAPYLSPRGGGGIAISPDGTRIVYPAIENGKRLLYMRNLDQLESRPIPGTENAGNPFFSYDGEWVAFFAYDPANLGSNKLKKVAVRGGPPLTICDAPIPPGGTWGADDMIVFGTGHDGNSVIPLFQVPAAGGTPKPILTPDPKKNERRFGWPDILPGGKAVLFSSTASAVLAFDEGHISVLSLASGTVRTIIEQGYHARYLASGHIVYMLGTNLMAVPFDVNRLEVTGPPVPLVEGVGADPAVGEASFAVSPTGFLVYARGSAATNAQRTLAMVDRQGHEQPLAVPPRTYNYPRVSPDGSRIALDIRDQENDVWIFDIARSTLTRFTFGASVDGNPTWTPDGSRIAFASDRDHTGTGNLYIAPADGSASRPERLSTSDVPQFPMGFSPDGKGLVFLQNSPKTSADLELLTLDTGHPIVPLLHTEFAESNGVVSPDGRWLAYQSNESGPSQIYVRSFPNVDSRLHQISTNGGTRPVWGPNGRELFYVNGNANGSVTMMAVPVQMGATFVAGTLQRLFDGTFFVGANGRTYDVTPDGQHFVMIKDQPTPANPAGPSQFVIVNNWFDELKRLAPGKKK
jgi:serine/threonine-protein kinase